ncbi:MAG TPA: glycosyltransferase [Candidatus Limnocylindria bacterium]|nr:glycosyltransferase [Candidatus Limnocylindria bacterium]
MTTEPAARPRRPDGGPDHEGAIAGADYTRHRRTQRSRGHDRPRLLQLLATGSTGGAQESYTGLLLRLDRTRFDVHAVSLSAGAAVHRLRRLGVDVDVIDEPDDASATAALTEYLRRGEIDLLHAHMYRAEVLGTRAAVAAGTPVIVATVHSSRTRSSADVALLARLTPWIDHLIVPSRSIELKVRAEGRTGVRFSIVPNGVDLERFRLGSPATALRPELGIPADGVLIGVVARLAAEKGLAYLLDSMPAVVDAVPNAWLLIVGEGPLAAELRERAGALSPPARHRIRFAGRRDEVSAITAELDIVVLPSLREAQGISLLEGMARARPVVATAVGGIPEVVTDGVDGLLVPPRDPAALADALVRLARSPALRRRLGEAGRRTVEERFSLAAMVRRVEAIYEEELLRAGVIAARPRSGRAPSRARDAAPADRAARELPPT